LIWMIGFPLAHEIGEWIRSKRSGPEKEYSESTTGFSELITVALWLGIGCALW